MNINKKVRSPWLIFTVLLISSFIVIEAAAFQIPALPFITEAFNIPITYAGSITICYYIAGIVFAPIMGRVGDQIGRKKLTIIGLVIFSASEFMAAFSPTFSIFLVARFIQGIGYACIFPTILAYIKDLFPEGKRGLPLGVFGGVGTLGAASGGVIGGLLIDRFGWSSIYWVSGILAIIGLIIVTFFIPKSSSGKAQSIDYLGGIVLLVTIASIVCLPLLITNLGWMSIFTIVAVSGAVIGLIVLFLVERRAKYPIIDMGILKIPGVYVPSMVVVLLTFSQIALTYSMTFFVSGVPGWGPVEVGLVATFSYLAAVLANPGFGWLGDKYKPRYFVLMGVFTLSIAAFLYTFIDTSTPLWFILMVSSIISFSLGAVQTNLKTIVVGSVPREKSGLGTGSFSMFRDLGIPLGSTFGLGLFGLQKASQTEIALLENARQAGVSDNLLSAVAEAGKSKEVTSELATNLQTLGIQFDELLNKSTLDGMSVALGNVGYVIIGVLIVVALFSLLLFKKNIKPEDEILADINKEQLSA